ncbi:hypothetical protein NPIL_23911 [Nephila pilipes]|uniref:Uncharacterized protein n=1 Tax=Nephila pilipes TaxID=299642 RepID=A0A8X6QEN5_NEPPI|nr:hypothetical protein NPIL_23911 [Nephila pilipes]
MWIYRQRNADLIQGSSVQEYLRDAPGVKTVNRSNKFRSLQSQSNPFMSSRICIVPLPKYKNPSANSFEPNEKKIFCVRFDNHARRRKYLKINGRCDTTE